MPDWHVVVFGAGHVAQALVLLLATMRCRVEVIEVRAEWLERMGGGGGDEAAGGAI